MNKDLEATLSELGPGYREVVDRLRASATAEDFGGHKFRRGIFRIDFRKAASLVAAMAVVVLGFAALFEFSPRTPVAGNSIFNSADSAKRVYTVAYAPTEAALEIIVASQRADGSWSNDFLTRQNAAALRNSENERMRIAYLRAVRYLRSKGLEPLTDQELRDRGESAAKALARI